MIEVGRHFVTSEEYDALRGLYRLKNRQYEPFSQLYSGATFRRLGSRLSSTFADAFTILMKNWLAQSLMQNGGSARRLLPSGDGSGWQICRFEEVGYPLQIDSGFFEFLARFSDAVSPGLRSEAATEGRTKGLHLGPGSRLFAFLMVQDYLHAGQFRYLDQTRHLWGPLGFPFLLGFGQNPGGASRPGWLEMAYVAATPLGMVQNWTMIRSWLELRRHNTEGMAESLQNLSGLLVSNLNFMADDPKGFTLTASMIRLLQTMIEYGDLRVERYWPKPERIYMLREKEAQNFRLEIGTSFRMIFEALDRFERKLRGISFVDENYELVSCQLKLYDRFLADLIPQVEPELRRYDEPVISGAGQGSAPEDRRDPEESQTSA